MDKSLDQDIITTIPVSKNPLPGEENLTPSNQNMETSNPIPPNSISNYPTVKNKGPKSQLLKIFFIIFIVFLFLVGGMFLLKTFSNPSTPSSPTPFIEESPVPEEDPTSDWTPYVNKALSFQIKTPKDWRAETNKEQAGSVWLKAPDESIIEITATDSASLSLPDFIQKVSDDAQTAWEGKPSKEFGEKIETSVGKYSATELGVKYLAAGFSTTVTYAKVKEKIFSFTILPPSSGKIEGSLGSENYYQILSTFKEYTPIDLTKWKNWTDPNGFTLMYPPNAKVKHLNENTIVESKTNLGTFFLSFCKDCVKDACSGTCDKEKEIIISVNGQKYGEKQISPNNEGNFTFRVVIAYPNTFVREKLAIFGNYPYEENLEEIENILSTFKFIEKKKE